MILSKNLSGIFDGPFQDYFPKIGQGIGLLGSLKCFYVTPKILFLPWMQFGFAETDIVFA